MSEDWNFSLCNVNDVLASVFIDLGLRERIPDKSRPHLLWVLVNLSWPREDGLSAPAEFDSLKKIEEKLTATLDLGFVWADYHRRPERVLLLRATL
jgi:hypothetical protein